MDIEIISTLRLLKTWLQDTMIEILKLFFLFKAAEKVIAERYERDFDMLFQY